MRCTDCGMAGATIRNRDAADVVHWWHAACWRAFRRWLSAPFTRVDSPHLTATHKQKRESEMGNWNISIHGVGSHHNKKLEADANRLAAKFVADLKAAGHTLSAATFTHGGEDNILDAEYLANRDKYEGG